jgi:hypothetical protein
MKIEIFIFNFIYISILKLLAASWKVSGSIPMKLLNFLIELIFPASLTIALGSTQPPTEMSTRNFLGGKGRPACKADNLAAIC